jgi:hypothetical protein
MENRKSILQTILHCLICVAVMNVSNLPTQARSLIIKDGNVSGAITIDTDDGTKTIKLKYAYAYAWVRQGKLAQIDIDFTDEPAPEDHNERKDFLMVMAREGKLQALRVEIFSNKKLGTIDLYGKSYHDMETIHDDPAMAAAMSRPPSPKAVPRGDQDDDEDSRAQVTLKTYNEKEVEGKLKLETMTAYDEDQDKQFQWAAEVTFKSSVVNKGDSATQVKLLPEGFGDAGKAYLNFYNAVLAEDAKSVKTFLSSENRKSLEGDDEQKRVARLKELLAPFKYIAPYSHTYEGDRSAQLYIQDAENTPFDHVSFKKGQMSHLPPISIGRNQYGTGGGLPGGVGAPPTQNKRLRRERPTAPKVTAPPMPQKPLPTVVGAARMLLEGNQWKVNWLLLDDPYLAWGHGFEPNVLWHLDTYLTEKEREEERERIDELPDGQVLPAGGGEPGKAYMAFCRAEKAGDKRSLIKYLTGAQYDLYAQAPVQIKPGAYIWKESSALEYLKLEIVEGRMQSEEAFLSVQAVRKGHRTTGKVRMILEEDQWKVEREKWETDYSKKVAAPSKAR